MLAIAWQYLTGRSVATDYTDRRQAEWPPHPDRVFQALVAAWGEGGQDPAEEEALRWLEALGAPELSCPLNITAADPVRVYVPVNDIDGPLRGDYRPNDLKLLPSQRPRQPRQFPSVHVGESACALVWPAAEPSHAEALSRLCAKVTRIGHSSSLVRMWLSVEPAAATLRPSEVTVDFRLRVPDRGRLGALAGAYASGGSGWRRPPAARWQGYTATDPGLRVPRGQFDERMLILRRTGGVQPTLAQAPILVGTMRNILIATADGLPCAKHLVSGHDPNGSPSRDAHVAIVPLAFVGDPTVAGGGRHADGRVMGLGLAMPVGLPPDVEQEILVAVAAAFRQKPDRELILRLGRAGVMSIAFDTPDAPAMALRPATWSKASRLWGSVTPVALDRSAPRRHRNLDAWAREQLVAACAGQGLPAPETVELLPVSPWLGGPSAREMPPLLRKDGTRRWHIHARLAFSEKCAGPIILGAGRYRGYGLFKPLSDTTWN